MDTARHLQVFDFTLAAFPAGVLINKTMETIIAPYEKRLYDRRLVPAGGAIFGIAGEKHRWSRRCGKIPVLSRLLDLIPAASILFARPAEPYNTLFNYLAATASGAVCPDDSETRAFLVDLPIIDRFSADAMARPLASRKCLIIRDHGILAVGQDGPSAAYVNFAAACFACFVKFFSDFLQDTQAGRMTAPQKKAFDDAVKNLPLAPAFAGGLVTGPFETPEAVQAAMVEAGAQIVSLGLVDACFGNLSYRVSNALFISKSGSFLDGLEGDIARCAMEDPVCAGQNPSSEYPAHLEIYRSTDAGAILHGHPLFSVIMSMDCPVACDHRGDCHRRCPYERNIRNTPVVSGETGGGPFGLYTTVPAMIKEKKAAIVYGHGVFTAAETDFNDALARMAGVEQRCRAAYFEALNALS